MTTLLLAGGLGIVLNCMFQINRRYNEDNPMNYRLVRAVRAAPMSEITPETSQNYAD